MRLLALSLAFASAVSLGFNLPAHAENHARDAAVADSVQKNLDAMQVKAKLALATDKFNGKLFDAQAQPITVEAAFQNPRSFEEGLTLVAGDQRFFARGELIEGGKAGMRLFFTKIVDGQAQSGQVMTIRPGMTKLELEARFKDMALSFAAVASKDSGKGRNVAGDWFTTAPPGELFSPAENLAANIVIGLMVFGVILAGSAAAFVTSQIARAAGAGPNKRYNIGAVAFIATIGVLVANQIRPMF